MPMFHQHPDGFVYVRTDAGTYGDTNANFALDYGLPPPLPSGITERIYEPGKRHSLIYDSSVIDGGPMPWPDGDAIIADYNNLIVAQEQRQEAEQKERETATKKMLEEIRAKAAQAT